MAARPNNLAKAGLGERAIGSMVPNALPDISVFVTTKKQMPIYMKHRAGVISPKEYDHARVFVRKSHALSELFFRKISKSWEVSGGEFPS